MKICPEHLKPFSDKSPNKGGFYWHVVNFATSEYCSKSKEEYDALPDPSETGTRPFSRPTEPTREPVEGRDFDAENRGKVRHGLVVAMIEHHGLNSHLKDSEKELINSYVEFVMTGK